MQNNKWEQKSHFYPEPIFASRKRIQVSLSAKIKIPWLGSRRCSLLERRSDAHHVSHLSRVTYRHLEEVTRGVTPSRGLDWRMMMMMMVVIIWPGPAETSLQPRQAGWSSHCPERGDKFVVVIVLFISVISVVRDHNGSWTGILFHSLHLCKLMSMQRRYSAHFCVLFERCYHVGVQSVTERPLAVCVESVICSGCSEGGINPRLLLRTAVRGLLANCFYI